MNTTELEINLKRAAAVAAAPRSIAEDVMIQIGSNRPEALPQWRWNHPYIAAGVAALSGLAAIVTFVFFLSSATPFTMADVQKAFEEQRWVHSHYDVGQIKDLWTNLQTGENFFTRYDGNVGYINNQTNIRLVYWNISGDIDQDTPTLYLPGQTPPKWSAHSAWEAFVAPFIPTTGTTQPTDSTSASSIAIKDSLNGVAMLRIDEYSKDMDDRRFLISQLWADPKTHLPVQRKTRLQLGEREHIGKEWSTCIYDFPATGPADLYALGVPRDLPINKQVTTAPTNVQPLISGINNAFDNFIKNYRAVVWSTVPKSVFSVEAIDIIWRQRDKVRDNRYLPGLDPLATLTLQNLLSWTGHHLAEEMQMMDSEREYSWRTTPGKDTKPQLQISPHGSFPLLATGEWPETIQWPTRYFAPDFELIAADVEAPKGCTGLRSDSTNFRKDFYIDPANDYLCMKSIVWTKRGSNWKKNREETLENLHRVAGHVVAGTQRTELFADPVKGYSASTVITTIDLIPMSDSDYPVGTFDPQTLRKDATVEGY